MKSGYRQAFEINNELVRIKLWEVQAQDTVEPITIKNLANAIALAVASLPQADMNSGAYS